MIKQKIYFDSPLFTSEGITKAARDNITYLQKHYDVMLSDTTFNSQYGEQFRNMYNPIDISKDEFIYFKNTRPEQWPYLKRKKIFGMHVLEGDVWPLTQVNAINNSNLYCLFVPSTHCKETAIKSGVKKPIEIFPHIIDSKFTYIKKESKETIFLFSGAIFGITETDRKGLDLMLKAWKKYENDSDKLLILKLNTFYARNMYQNKGAEFNLDNYLKHLYQKELPKNIIVFNQNMTEDQIIKLYQQSDCVLCPTRGEGWGLIPYEGLACGTPCIVTEGLGCDEYLNKLPGGYLKIKQKGLIPAEKRYPYFDPTSNVLSNWVEPDQEHFEQQIEVFVNNKERFLAEAKEASKIIHNMYNGEKVAIDIKAIMDKYIGETND